jgi:hypothetical protein
MSPSFFSLRNLFASLGTTRRVARILVGLNRRGPLSA